MGNTLSRAETTLLRFITGLLNDRSKVAWCRVCITVWCLQNRNPHQHKHINPHFNGETQLNGQIRTLGARAETPDNFIMLYDRILSIKNLSDVPNPWRGLTMNRCLVLALAVLLVSSGVNELLDAMDSIVEETGIKSFVGSLQEGSVVQISIWDSFTWWWGSEELGAIRRRKKPIGNKTILKPKMKE